MIDLYYWPTPNGWKITIMLEECGLPYNAIPVDIRSGEVVAGELFRTPIEERSCDWSSVPGLIRGLFEPPGSSAQHDGGIGPEENP